MKLILTTVLFLALACTAGAERWVRQGRGPSMLPALPEACWIEILVGGRDQVRTGEVIFFLGREGNRVAHLVVEITPEGHFITRGVNNPRDDAIVVTPERFIGRVPRWAPLDAPEALRAIALPAAHEPLRLTNADFTCTP